MTITIIIIVVVILSIVIWIQQVQCEPPCEQSVIRFSFCFFQKELQPNHQNLLLLTARITGLALLSYPQAFHLNHWKRHLLGFFLYIRKLAAGQWIKFLNVNVAASHHTPVVISIYLTLFSASRFVKLFHTKDSHFSLSQRTWSHLPHLLFPSETNSMVSPTYLHIIPHHIPPWH